MIITEPWSRKTWPSAATSNQASSQLLLFQKGSSEGAFLGVITFPGRVNTAFVKPLLVISRQIHNILHGDWSDTSHQRRKLESDSVFFSSSSSRFIEDNNGVCIWIKTNCIHSNKTHMILPRDEELQWENPLKII